MDDDLIANDIVAQLIHDGLASPHGVDADGEFTIEFDWERLESEHPGLYAILRQAQMEELQAALNHLEELGLIEVYGIDIDGNLSYQTTELGRAVIGEMDADQ